MCGPIDNKNTIVVHWNGKPEHQSKGQPLTRQQLISPEFLRYCGLQFCPLYQMITEYGGDHNTAPKVPCNGKPDGHNTPLDCLGHPRCYECGVKINIKGEAMAN